MIEKDALVNNVEQFLTAHGIIYKKHGHAAVFTCEEAAEHCKDIPGIASKNLFLTNKRSTRFFLITIPAYKRANLQQFAALVGETHLHFAPPNLLQEKLGVNPGSVSPFGIINNDLKDVEVYIDSDVYDAPILGFHPNVNTATLEITNQMFKKFLEVTGYQVRVCNF